MSSADALILVVVAAAAFVIFFAHGLHCDIRERREKEAALL